MYTEDATGELKAIRALFKEYKKAVAENKGKKCTEDSKCTKLLKKM
jgi:hypothetical protein